MLRAVLSTEKACYSGSFHSNIRVQSKHDCYGSEPARLWKADAKGIRVSRRTRKHKGDSFVLGVCLTDLFLLGNFHQLSASSTKEFFVMPKFDGITLSSNFYPTTLRRNTGDYDLVHKGYSNTANSSNEAEIEVFSLEGSTDDYFLLLRSDYLSGLSDEAILKTVKAGREIATRNGHINYLRWLTQRVDKVVGLYTLEEMKKDTAESVEYLTEYLDSYQDVDTFNLVAQHLNNLAGNNIASGHVYCITDQLGHYKIGMTSNLPARFKQLGTQPPFEIELVAAHHVFDMREYEASLHWLFDRKRLRGEWFKLSEGDVQSFIDCSWTSSYIARKFREHGGL